MITLDQPRPIRRMAAAIVAAGALAIVSLAMTSPVGAVSPPELTLSKTTAVSTAEQGDHIQVSGSGCTPDVGILINVLLFPGAFGPTEVPPVSNVSGSGYSPDAAGNWSGSFPIIAGLTPGQYTIRAACFPEGSSTTDFWYLNAVITVTDGSVTPPDTPVAPASTVPGKTATTSASPASQAAAAPHPVFTG